MFHLRVSFASCIKLGSLTCNKEPLLLQTLFFCPQSFRLQALLQQVARFCSGKRRQPWGLSSFLLDWQHREAGAGPGWDLYLGHAAGPPTPAGMAQAPPALPGAPPAPSHPTQNPSGCSPAPHPYLCPLIFHVFIKQEVFSWRLHCAEGNCFCHCSPKGCTFLRQLDLYQAQRCRDKDCWISVGWHGLT